MLKILHYQKLVLDAGVRGCLIQKCPHTNPVWVPDQVKPTCSPPRQLKDSVTQNIPLGHQGDGLLLQMSPNLDYALEQVKNHLEACFCSSLISTGWLMVMYHRGQVLLFLKKDYMWALGTPAQSSKAWWGKKNREKQGVSSSGKVVVRTEGQFKMPHLTQVCSLFSSTVSWI